jgi:thiol:disulfide interchange protein
MVEGVKGVKYAPMPSRCMKTVKNFFPYIFLGVFVYIVYLCHPSEASTWDCVIPGGYPPQD